MNRPPTPIVLVAVAASLAVAAATVLLAEWLALVPVELRLPFFVVAFGGALGGFVIVDRVFRMFSEE